MMLIGEPYVFIVVTFHLFACSGDTDSVVPVTATRFSIGHLRLKVEVPWYPWYSGRQVLYFLHATFLKS
jgi:hypothetical protein